MSAPVAPFSRLTLEDMSPATRSNSQAASQASSAHYPMDESSSDLESDSDGSEFDDDDEAAAVIRSPSNLKYRIDHLSDKTQTAIRDVFSDPPKIALQRCRRIDNTYAFQMTELVTRSIRIHAGDDGSTRFTCSCGDEKEPCEHLLWLLDQLTKQTLYDYDPEKPLTMTEDGFAQEMGDPFKNISEYHLDVLADGLHCQVVDPEAPSEELLISHRVQEARELLSAVYAVPSEDFRPDIFGRPASGKKVLKRNDLDCTIFRMLLDNHHFFQYFLSVSRPTDPINDPFRKIYQRVDRVLYDFDIFLSNPKAGGTSGETQMNVSWAANHLLGCTKLIKSAIYNRDKPLQPSEAISAARTLVHILVSVVSRNRDASVGANRIERNLYLNLIGDRDRDFVVAELDLLPGAASQFLHSLEDVDEEIGKNGAPASYVAKFRKLLERLRTPAAGASLKRHVTGQGTFRSSKRMK
ncbi:hypothetical protein PT974_08962 [Cladobotryum mycophilum]|uniref:SWIM-type domain-containing protein n=1 Tax=Cladobotryum mycophilum TaxID=491253 RepID=A0ABR0SEX1_9HYPO